MAARIPRVPVREQDPKVRAHNFEEVCYGYDLAEATTEASRCLHCKNPRCVAACPVGVDIPEFIAHLAAGDIKGAAGVIARDSSLPAVWPCMPSGVPVRRLLHTRSQERACRYRKA